MNLTMLLVLKLKFVFVFINFLLLVRCAYMSFAGVMSDHLSRFPMPSVHVNTALKVNVS